mmetsp:Transcript_75398/g.196031  ORF Transcript_75398/g.196031 Transcript_75398/m.196031 type:complete len:111 (+) Transcript_75398:214-546(+)
MQMHVEASMRIGSPSAASHMGRDLRALSPSSKNHKLRSLLITHNCLDHGSWATKMGRIFCMSSREFLNPTRPSAGSGKKLNSDKYGLSYAEGPTLCTLASCVTKSEPSIV